MERPALLVLLAAALAASGCASLKAWAYSGAPPPPPDIHLPHPESPARSAYEAGLLAMVKGDGVRARIEWNRCLDRAAPDSPQALDCMVAIERLGSASSTASDGNK